MAPEWHTATAGGSGGVRGSLGCTRRSLMPLALRYVGAAGTHEHGVQRLAGRHVEAVALGTAEAEVGADLGQQDHADALALRRKDVYAIVACAAAGSRPDVAVDIGADSVRSTGPVVELHVGEQAPAAQLVGRHVEDLYVTGGAGIDDVQLLVVGGKTDAVGLVESVGRPLDAGRLGIHAVDGLFDLLPRRKSLVASHDAVGRVGEPDAAIGMDHEVVGRIQGLAVELVGDHGDAALVLVTHDAAASVLAGELAAFEIEGVSVAVARRVAEDADVPDALGAEELPVVGNVAPKQVLSLGAPRRPLRPSGSDVVAVDDGVKELV